eukprot:TRINITY_DN28972_c0_g1_i1.p1 TRINITY_DN28972_c0_g1~~TRINITY_DN28972_c0_g1_i1.p1  ORF type:complete len:499 (-),score=44.69 TRINITY_DN28972_c0_g1_i1:243-1739(-)
MLQRIMNQRRFQLERESSGMFFNDMPIEVQQRVFGKVEQRDRITKLPLVCSQWKKALEVPSQAWADFMLAPMLHKDCYLLGQTKQNQEEATYKQLENWLRNRIEGMRLIRVSDRFGNDEKCKKIYGALLNNLQYAQELETLQLTFKSTIVVDQFLPAAKHFLSRITSLSLETWNVNFTQERTNALAHFTSLKSLTIGALYGYGDNEKQPILEGFPQGVLSLTNLEYLQVRSRGVTTVPSEISQLTKLKVLNMEGCLIQSLPMSMSKMNNLQQLNISKNRIGEYIHVLSEVIFSIPNLQSLDCSSNQLPEFPLNSSWQLFSDPNANQCNLQQLNLSQNYLEQLPGSFSQLVNLSDLNLVKNSFQQVPEVLKFVPQLKMLDMSANRFLQNSDVINALMQKQNFQFNLPHQLLQENIVAQEDENLEVVEDWMNQSPFSSQDIQDEQNLCGAQNLNDQQTSFTEQNQSWSFFRVLGQLCTKKISTLSNKLSQIFPNLEVEWI